MARRRFRLVDEGGSQLRLVSVKSGSVEAYADEEGEVGGISEAPQDGLIYGRKDAAWVAVKEPKTEELEARIAALEARLAAVTP